MSKFDVFKDGRPIAVVDVPSGDLRDAREKIDAIVNEHGFGTYGVREQGGDTCEVCGGPWHALLGCYCEMDDDEAAALQANGGEA